MKINSDARLRLARKLLEAGPATAAALAAALGLTGTAVRRHLENLAAEGLVESHERAPFGPRNDDSRGRGRPARFYSLTSAGREHFEERYDTLAIDALRALQTIGGPAAVHAFARERMARTLPHADDLAALSAAMTDLGFAAEVRPAPVGQAVQLCQRNCPIGHVATEFPEFCEAETELIAERLGSAVTRLSTISSGAPICTTQVHARRVS